MILKLIKNSVFLSTTSFLGLALSLIAIPTHLSILGKNDYGNYVFFHFIFAFGLILNFGLSKIVAIELAKKNYVNLIIIKSIKLTIIIIITILSLYYSFTFFINNKNQFFLLIGIGTGSTIFYLTLEGILQGLKKFKFLAFVNFIFYSLSLNIPSIYLLINKSLNYIDLIKISIFIKSISILIILYILNKNNFLILNKKKYNFDFLKEFQKYTFWYFLNIFSNLLYDFADKYLIKQILGPVSLAIYAIPGHITGKISILSKSFSAVLLPELSNNNLSKNFYISLKLFVFLFPIPIIIIAGLFEPVLKLWLGKNYVHQIYNLTKIFFGISWLSTISHILIVYYEANKKIKINSLIEIILLFPFIITMFYIVPLNNLELIAVILLFKELLLLNIRLLKIKFNKLFFILIYASLTLFFLSLAFSFNNQIYYYLFAFIMTIFNIFVFFKFIK